MALSANGYFHCAIWMNFNKSSYKSSFWVSGRPESYSVKREHAGLVFGQGCIVWNFAKDACRATEGMTEFLISGRSVGLDFR